MRYLIVSDIHANRFGLEAVLEAAHGEWDQVLCLGDVVGYGAHPNECCALLRDVEAFVVTGNHDAAALGFLSPDGWSELAAVAIHWTRAQLSTENWRWLRRAGDVETIAGGQEGLSFLLTHGNLKEPFYEEYILNAADAYDDLERLQQREARLCFFGHTHSAIAYHVQLPWRRDSDVQAMALPHGGSIAIEPDALYLINPGSCGQPRDGNPQARYALFDATARHVDVHAVDYDVEGAREAINWAGLPCFLGDRLREGR